MRFAIRYRLRVPVVCINNVGVYIAKYYLCSITVYRICYTVPYT